MVDSVFRSLDSKVFLYRDRVHKPEIFKLYSNLNILIRLLLKYLAHSDIKIDTYNGGVPGAASTAKSEDGDGKKERSVLQAKLTRLAIQIGYGGTIGSLLFH